MVSFSTTGLLLPVALFPPGTTHDCAIGQAGPSIWSRLPPAFYRGAHAADRARGRSRSQRGGAERELVVSSRTWPGAGGQEEEGHHGHLVRDLRLDRPAIDAARATLRGAASAPGSGRRGRLFLLSHRRAPRDTARDGSVTFGVPGGGGAAHATHPFRSAGVSLAAVLATPFDRRDLHARSSEWRATGSRRRTGDIAV